MTSYSAIATRTLEPTQLAIACLAQAKVQLHSLSCGQEAGLQRRGHKTSASSPSLMAVLACISFRGSAHGCIGSRVHAMKHSSISHFDNRQRSRRPPPCGNLLCAVIALCPQRPQQSPRKKIVVGSQRLWVSGRRPVHVHIRVHIHARTRAGQTVRRKRTSQCGRHRKCIHRGVCRSTSANLQSAPCVGGKGSAGRLGLE